MLAELKEWAIDVVTDPFKYLKKRWRSPRYWLGLMPVLFIYLNAMGIGAISSFFSLVAEQFNLNSLLWTIGNYASHITTAAGSFLSSLPFMGPVIAPIFSTCFIALKTVFGPLLAGLGLASNPVGWGITALLALPAIAGGVYEAGTRLLSSAKNQDGSINILRLSFALSTAIVTIPINFLYGFCRTAYHLMTGKGYYGAFKEAKKNIDIDIVKENALSDFGGGSIFRCLIPPVVDRALGLAVIGPIVGFFAGAYNTLTFKNFPWSLASLPAAMWRGLWSGTRAAVDTGTYYGSGVQSAEVAQAVVAAPDITNDNFSSSLSSYAAVTKDLSMGQGFISGTSKYDVAETLAEMAVLKKRTEDKDISGEAKEELTAKYNNLKANADNQIQTATVLRR